MAEDMADHILFEAMSLNVKANKLKKASEVAGEQVHKLLAFQSKRNLDMDWMFLILITNHSKFNFYRINWTKYQNENLLLEVPTFNFTQFVTVKTLVFQVLIAIVTGLEPSIFGLEVRHLIH